MTHQSAALPSDVKQPSDPRSLRRVGAASLIGTTIEYYDFFVYGTAAALVFPAVFFPSASPAMGTIASFATFGVAFFARPVGSIIFGHFGDKIGRKRTLVWTLLIMGLSTVAIGLFPGYDTGVFGILENGIGIWAPILLVAMRFLQGLAMGGEWAGATLLTAEYAPQGQRGRMAVYPQLGPACAFFLASGTFFLASVTIGATSETFLNYGWRLPFIASLLLVMVGLWIRLSIEETPVFKNHLRTRETVSAPEKLPFADAFREQWKQILIAGLAMSTVFSMFYTGSTFLTSYGIGNLEFTRTMILGFGMIAAVALGVVTSAACILSDKLGRKKVIAVAYGAAIVWSLALFPLLDTGSPIAFLIGVTVTLCIYGVANGPAGALLPEMFKSRFRYTGAGLSYNLGGIIGGAIPPILAAQIVATSSSIWVGVLLAALSAVSLLCVLALPETKDRNLEDTAAR
ncbi:MFS transporter [Mycolicibacterium murale]|jgi:MFS family permease|uniref:MFS transporter n=1 Tax=Mycolicibacterium murale TaxID=182220 RepID=A0A7I9WUI1_9MYCO|nr:MFS transporter [Mycolicibacterium murale]ANW63738.1 MFS transporter [Mycobacterium sp. djl-10]MCV7181513.1 MHS family MFS transporter [Mycolicibacterium murale]GFG61038.1 MFS transporter [Mycolicibacterium murale]